MMLGEKQDNDVEEEGNVSTCKQLLNFTLVATKNLAIFLRKESLIY